MENNEKKVSWRRVVLICLCVILSLVLLLLIVAAIMMDRLLGSINRAPEQHQTLSSSELEELQKPEVTIGEDYTGPIFNADEITVPTETVNVIDDEDVVNILLLGQDRRGGTRNGLTDVMLLCSVNKETKTLTMTSFMRDLYLEIPGNYRADKLNMAYPIGGFKMIDAALEVNFGVKVDGNVEVDFRQFAKIIDSLGGVDIEISGAESNYLLKQGYYVKAGMDHLNGAEALAYSRIRMIDNDFNRTNRQRKVVTAIINQFKNASLGQITDTLVSVLRMITTDMTDAEIMGYAIELAPLLKDLQIKSQRIPADDTYYFGHVRDQNIVDCIFIKDFETNRQLIADIFED